MPYYRPAEDSAETEVPAGAAQGARRLPAAAPHDAPTARRCPRSTPSSAMLEATRRARDLDDDGVRPHPDACSLQGQGHRPARRADRARRGAHLRHGGHVPPDRHLFLDGPALHAAGRRPAACTTARTRRARSSRRASTKAARSARWIAAGTAYANHGVSMIPFYIYYSMFGFQRVGDFVWAARRHAGARLPDRRHGRAHDARGRGAAAPGRPQPARRHDDPELRRLRPDATPTSSP